MAGNHTYTVEIRFYGDHLDPHSITQYLGLEPSTCRKSKGDSVWGYNGCEIVGFQDEWTTLEEGLSFLTQTLFPQKDKIVKLSNDFKSIWWCGHFQSSLDGGPTLSSQLLKDIAEFNTPLFIDNYFCS